MTDAELGERVLRAMGAERDNLLGWKIYDEHGLVVHWTMSERDTVIGWSAVALLDSEIERRNQERKGWEWDMTRQEIDGERVYLFTVYPADPEAKCGQGQHPTDPGRAFALAFLEACSA